jgi:hypothetical protein
MNRSGSTVLAITLVLLASAASSRVLAADSRELPPPRVRAWQTGLLRPDRLQHASLAFSAGLAAGVLTREPTVALESAMSLGLLKEIWDRRRGRFDFVDLAADGIGAGLAAVATAALKR